MDVEEFLGLRRLMDFALKTEKRLNALWQAWESHCQKGGRPPNGGSRFQESRVHTTNSHGSVGGSRSVEKFKESEANLVTPVYKKKIMLTGEEFQKRREKGLCYNCNEKFSPGHQCKKTLQFFIVAEEDKEIGEEEHIVQDIKVGKEPEEEEQLLLAQVSLNTMLGITHPKSMKLKRSIHGAEVVVMIDGGASHNFISIELKEKFKLSTDLTVQFAVILGIGETNPGQGVCRGVPFQVQGVTLRADFLPFYLKGTDLILGMSWLTSLGWTKIHWERLLLRFELNGQKVTLEGDQQLSCSHLSQKSLGRVMITKQLAVLELHQLELNEDECYVEVSKEIHHLKSKFPMVFDPPTGLPPAREVDHAITLVPNVQPVNIRPYRYSFIQKDEIERLIRELLEAELIRPPKSPFASPVLLVKKKDQGWRFCVGYRALNALTIPN
ncbi:uncharacterized protein LOC144708753 [Wolffia australiana]